MAGQIKKGFFFYFGLFVLLLITIFFICLVIMIFNPGKTLLWMQYFSSSSYIKLDTTTDTNQADINWSLITDLDIECGYADVIVEKNVDKDMKEDGVYIYNGAKGFSGASSAVQFGYEVYYTGPTRLKVIVTEPSGFLYFSKEFRIVVHASSVEDLTNTHPINFANMNLTVTTREGNVQIGGVSAKQAKPVGLKSLNVETESGNILTTDMFDANTLVEKSNLGESASTEAKRAFDLRTDSGKISSAKSIEYAGKSGTGLALNVESCFITDKGEIEFGILATSWKKDIVLTCKSGSVEIAFLNAAKTRCVNCVQGNYLFDYVEGGLFFESEDSIISPNVRVKYLDGDFFLSENKELGGKPDVELFEVTGDVSMLVDNGSLTVLKAHKNVIVDSKDNLKVNIVMAETASGNINIVNKSGDVNLGFMGVVPETVDITTDSGNVRIRITKNAVFVANSWVNNQAEDDERTRVDTEKIEVNIGDEMTENNPLKNPLTVPPATTDARGKIEIVTNAKIFFTLVPISDFVVA